MASGGGGTNNATSGVVEPMDTTNIDHLSKLAHELYKSVKKDQFVKAKFILKGTN